MTGKVINTAKSPFETCDEIRRFEALFIADPCQQEGLIMGICQNSKGPQQPNEKRSTDGRVEANIKIAAFE